MEPRSFGTKVLLVVVLASAAAVVVACLILVPLHYHRKKELVLGNLQSQADVIAVHSTAALSFDDVAAGHETLAALRAVDGVEAAGIFTTDGTLFASYQRPGTEAPLPNWDHGGVESAGRWVFFGEPILHEGRQLGTLVLTYDMRPLMWMLWQNVGLAALAAVLSTAMAGLLALRLRRVLVEPVSELTRTARRFADAGDFSARARRMAEDELGQLTDVFNRMLSRIEEQAGEIRRSNAELKARNLEMEQFVYTVSHDLKSPLVTITGFVGLLDEDIRAGRTEEVLEAADHLRRASAKMSELIDDLLQLSRIGRVPNEYEQVEVTPLVEEVVMDLETRLRQVGARVEVQPEMPTVAADRTRLIQVFDNLLNNAIKYGCGDGEECVIEVGGRSDGDEAVFFVRDHGQGIAPEYHDKVFGLFQRLDNRAEGTGVGLAVVARVVEIHGGRVWIESDVGRGATFWFSLPRQPPAA